MEFSFIQQNQTYLKKGSLFIFGRGLHLSKPTNFRNPTIASSLLGRRKKVDILDLSLAFVQLKQALSFIKNQKSKSEGFKHVLFVRQQPYIKSLFTASLIGHCQYGFLSYRWPAGILQNWHSKVRIPLINFFLNSNYQPKLKAFAENYRYKKRLKGFSLMKSKPDMVIFFECPSRNALKDCWLSGTPSIRLVDSRVNSNFCTYAVGIEHESIWVQRLFFSIFIKALSVEDLPLFY